MSGLLPTTKSKPNRVLESQTILIYGPPKIGKSTFCSQMEEPIFLATEPGLNALEVYQVTIDSWEKFLAVAAELAKNGVPYKNIIIDTVDNLYQFCEQSICKKAGIEHPGDMGFGKGFALVNNEFTRVIKKLSLLRYGIVFVSHSKEKEVDSRTGKFQKTTPTLSGGAAKAIMGLSDMILLFESQVTTGKNGEVAEKRVIRTRASKSFDAGSRWELPDEIPLSFADFKKAYENKGAK